jgi:hypothetical protein
VATLLSTISKNDAAFIYIMNSVDKCTCCGDTEGGVIRIKAKLRPLLITMKKVPDLTPKIEKPIIATVSKETVFDIPLYETDIIVNDPRKAGEILKEYGCVVVPCFEDGELREIYEMTKEDISNYPEYRGDGETAATANLEILPGDGLDYRINVRETERAPASSFDGRAGNEKNISGLRKAITRFSGQRIKHILGAFQAHGNPSSFHCPSARLVRLRCYERCHQLFAHVEDGGGWNIEMNYDRVGLRQKGTKITEDSDKWHRDVITGKYLEEGDSIFGGWINLDLKSHQRFICDLRTHQRPGATGFYREQPNGKANSITIPPGHCIIFYQHILHAVAPTTFKQDSYRQFISFRLTHSKVPLWGKDVKKDTWSQQLTPKTPSDQVIKVWMSNHHTSALLWSHTIIWGLVTFKEEYIEKRQGKGKAKAVYFLPEAPMSPKYELNMYPSYTREEKDILVPQPL